MLNAMNIEALRENPVATLDRLAGEQATVCKEISDLHEWISEVQGNYYWKRMMGANSLVVFDGRLLQDQLLACQDKVLNCLQKEN